MSFDDGVNSSFYISVLTIIGGSVGLAIRYFYRSKCKQCECCVLKVTRDVETEKEEDMMNQNKSKSTDEIALQNP
jgi:hypothetical protein